jgi:hypothetical protein
MLTLDPAPLPQALGGAALEQVTAEIRTRRAARRPAQLAVLRSSVAFYRAADDAPTVLVQYVDGTTPLNPWTGRPVRSTAPPPMVRETFTMSNADGAWKVVASTREEFGKARLEETPEGRAPREVPDDLAAAQRYIAQVLEDASFTNDASRLGEILGGEVLARGITALEERRARGYAWQEVRDTKRRDFLRLPDGSVYVVETYVDSGTWVEASTKRRLERERPPLLLRRISRLQQIDGRWNVVEGWWVHEYGPAIP